MPPPSKPVVLIVDYGDRSQKHFNQIPWQRGMTVLGALQFARQHPRGIRYQYQGKAATALLIKIDDLPNRGQRSRNWIFRVNNKLGDRSFAVFELKPGDTVLWKFQAYP